MHGRWADLVFGNRLRVTLYEVLSAILHQLLINQLRLCGPCWPRHWAATHSNLRHRGANCLIVWLELLEHRQTTMSWLRFSVLRVPHNRRTKWWWPAVNNHMVHGLLQFSPSRRLSGGEAFTALEAALWYESVEQVRHSVSHYGYVLQARCVYRRVLWLGLLESVQKRGLTTADLLMMRYLSRPQASDGVS
jgi:hypothetical protein